MPAPNIAEINCQRIQFEDGDRILVRVFRPLDDAQSAKLRRTIQSWAGKRVEVLIVNAAVYDIQIQRGAAGIDPLR